LQKLIQDEVGKKYYISVWVYENSKRSYFVEGMQAISFAPDVQFRMHKEDEVELPTVNMEFIMDNSSTIQEVEGMIERYWKCSGKPYYEVYYKD